MKLFQSVLLLFCIVYPGFVLPIKTIGKKRFPLHLQSMFTMYDDDDSQRYCGEDTFGRHITQVQFSNGRTFTYLWYTDKSGMLWKILRNEDTRKEEVFLNLIGNDGTIHRYHPNTVKQFGLSEVIPSERILYPPDYLPLSDGFVTDDDIFSQLSTKEGQSLAVPTSIEPEIDGTDGVMMMDDTIDDYLPDISTSTTPIFSSEDTVWWPYMAIGSAIFLGASVVYYLSTNVATGFRYLRRTDLWSAWRPEESYEALLMVEPSYLVDSLMEAITFKYYPDDNPAARFFEDVQQEYDELLQWMQFRNRIWLSPGGAFDILEQRLQLLDHMRKVVSYWQAQQIIKNASQ